MRINKTITVGAAPINVFTGTIAAQGACEALATRIFIQMQPSSVGLGYVMDGIYKQRVPSKNTPADVTAYMAPSAGATSPGGSYGDPYTPEAVDVNSMWVDGSNAGDLIKVSYYLKV